MQRGHNGRKNRFLTPVCTLHVHEMYGQTEQFHSSGSEFSQALCHIKSHPWKLTAENQVLRIPTSLLHFKASWFLAQVAVGQVGKRTLQLPPLSLYLSLSQCLSLSFQHTNGWCVRVKRNSAAISTAGKFASNWRDRGPKEGDGEL